MHLPMLTAHPAASNPQQRLHLGGTPGEAVPKYPTLSPPTLAAALPGTEHRGLGDP